MKLPSHVPLGSVTGSLALVLIVILFAPLWNDTRRLDTQSDTRLEQRLSADRETCQRQAQVMRRLNLVSTTLLTHLNGTTRPDDPPAPALLRAYAQLADADPLNPPPCSLLFPPPK